MQRVVVVPFFIRFASRRSSSYYSLHIRATLCSSDAHPLEAQRIEDISATSGPRLGKQRNAHAPVGLTDSEQAISNTLWVKDSSRASATVIDDDTRGDDGNHTCGIRNAQMRCQRQIEGRHAPKPPRQSTIQTGTDGRRCVVNVIS